jgi:hypothetical protein
MWWNGQNLDRPRKDKSGKRWNFRVWHEVWTEDNVVVLAERIFFWDDKREFCGVVLLPKKVHGTHVSRLRSLIEKLVAEPGFRSQHKRDLKFPLERHYSDYGVFPEENSN